MTFPSEFSEPWAMSDVVLHTENSDGKLLHACKAVLAMHSTYFHSMFFSGQMCVDRILTKHCDHGTIHTAFDLNLHDAFMEILRRPHGTCHFNNVREDEKIFFCKSDLLVFYKMETDEVLTRDPDFPRIVSPVNLEDIATESKFPRIDLTQKWPTSDVGIITNSSKGRLLYANKAALAALSPYFHKIFFEGCEADRASIPVQESAGVITVLHVNAEYTTMKEILSIIHHSDMDFTYGAFKKRHEILLYDMYVTAGEDQLDIPMIRKGVVYHFNHCYYEDLPHGYYSYVFLEVALKVHVSKERLRDIILHIAYGDLVEWVFTDEMDIVYMKNGQQVNLLAGQTQPILMLERCKLFMKRVEWERYDPNVESDYYYNLS